MAVGYSAISRDSYFAPVDNPQDEMVRFGLNNMNNKKNPLYLRIKEESSPN